MCTGFKCGCNGNAVWICVGCRTTAKDCSIHRFSRIGRKDVFKIHSGCDLLCPHCGKKMQNKGNKFRPPRKENLRAWKRLGHGVVHEVTPVNRYRHEDERVLRLTARKERLEKLRIEKST